ncbi:cGMP-dependent 3',5'-cyclic phosphodiesterase [Monoraphidium neglectum]|uniref:cGMP-dependent 3',5'-cyclic phosphodiesterase n=1 Tax=Monoraphidium neglectum TaxID=145388 RepID=A0A0D2LXJ3_9CHLO|nr:cGMP-dependent 3',5'-cyclic phosphodiesterase [Monoraphidium neglectum]KIY94196.1 cGMP-dependent 3',5'-cyclic phosphodiesterase [Monoraphidium neglectum]|eukprot:XP_013893216.1 cGMP-dependent 3',5'-cyclic phosphodiesterase [Monoraphidium neglectum]
MEALAMADSAASAGIRAASAPSHAADVPALADDLELHSDYVAKSLLRAIQLINRLTLELNVHEAMRSVRQVALELLECERVTLFLVLRSKRELRGRMGDEAADEVISVRFGEGIAGRVALTGGLLNVRDAYSHPLFHPGVDAKTGFRTRNILACAVKHDDCDSEPIAVLQARRGVGAAGALNKRGGADFSAVDEQHLKLFSVHLGNTLAKIRFYEEAKREKERMAALSQCFKKLAKASSLDCALGTITEAVQELVHAERVVVFLMDHARGVLWSSFVHPVTGHVRQIRTKQHAGCVGRCATSKQQLCLDLREDPGPRDDPVLRQLLAAIEDSRVSSALLQPVLDPSTDGCMAVLVALNKVGDDVADGAFEDGTFTRSDRYL